MGFHQDEGKKSFRVQNLVFGIKIIGGNFGCWIYDKGVLRFRFVIEIYGVRYERWWIGNDDVQWNPKCKLSKKRCKEKERHVFYNWYHITRQEMSEWPIGLNAELLIWNELIHKEVWNFLSHHMGWKILYGKLKCPSDFGDTSPNAPCTIFIMHQTSGTPD